MLLPLGLDCLVFFRCAAAARGGQILIHQNSIRLTLEILELSTLRRPEKHPDAQQAKDNHSRDQTVDYIHSVLLCSVRNTLRCYLNRVLIRAALPITSSELTGIETAATNGVTNAIIASGTMIRL